MLGNLHRIPIQFYFIVQWRLFQPQLNINPMLTVEHRLPFLVFLHMCQCNPEPAIPFISLIHFKHIYDQQACLLNNKLG